MIQSPGFAFNKSTQLIIAILIGLLLGVGFLVVLPPYGMIAILVVILLAIIIAKQPALGILGILAINATIIEQKNLPLFNLGPLRISIAEILLFFLLGLIVFRWLTERDYKFVRTPLGPAIFSFLGVSALASVAALLRNTDPDTLTDIGAIFRSPPEYISLAIPAIWTISYYAVYFAITNLIRNRKQLNLLLNGFFLLAWLTAALTIIQYIAGTSLPFLPGRVETLVTEGSTYRGVTRILPPGQSIILVVFPVLFVESTFDSVKLRNGFQYLKMTMIGFALLITFTRGYWAAALLTLALVFINVKWKEREKYFERILIGALVVTMILFALILIPKSPIGDQILNAASERFLSMSNLSAIAESDTLNWRILEYEYAFPKIIRYPLLGLGLGSRYRPYDIRLDSDVFDGRTYIHNGHFYIILQSGLLGYLCLLWVLSIFIYRGINYWKLILEAKLRAVVLGFALVNFSLMFSAIVAPIYMDRFWTPVIGFMLGVNDVIFRLATPERLDC